MTDYSSYYGKVDDGGATVMEPEYFIDSAQPFVVGMPSVRVRVPNTPYFYRLEAGSVPTELDHEAWRNAIQTPPKTRGTKADSNREASE